MSIKDLTKFTLKIIVSAYFAGVAAFIILSIGSDQKDYFADAFSPMNLINEVFAGNISFIYISALLMAFLLSFNSLRKKKVDYWTGRGWRGGS